MRDDMDVLSELEKVFSPSSPISSKDLFAGRLTQVQLACDAINERGQHFVVYGERGVGKTSMANVLNEHLQHVVVSKVTCNRDERFRQVWDKALSKVNFESSRQGIGFTATKVIEPKQLNLFLPTNKKAIDALDIQEVFETVQANLCFVFDEFDGIRGRETQEKFADTIKTLSDNAPFVTIGIVGVAESVSELIGHHQSLERCLKQIEMPRMSKDELRSIISTGLERLNVQMEGQMREEIVIFSSGFPHFTHLLAKYSVKECLARGSRSVNKEDYETAISKAIENSSQSIRENYQQATIAAKTKSKFEDVIWACALAECDEHETFSTKDLVDPYRVVTGEQIEPGSISYNIGELCKDRKGKILERIGESKNIRFRFKNPLMKVFVKLKAAQAGTALQPSLFRPN